MLNDGLPMLRAESLSLAHEKRNVPHGRLSGPERSGQPIFRQKSGLEDPNLALFRCAEIAKKREKSF
jgi:hypothetical protein